MFTTSNVKQFSIKVHMKVPRSTVTYKIQIEGALTLNAFADNASVIFGTKSNSLSDDRNVRAGW